MKRISLSFGKHKSALHVAAVIAALLTYARQASGGAIHFELSATSVSVARGGTAIFQGMVTNNSGADLNASDFSLNFFGFDATLVTPTQDLGLASQTSQDNTFLFSLSLLSSKKGNVTLAAIDSQAVKYTVDDGQTIIVAAGTLSSPPPQPGGYGLSLDDSATITAATFNPDITVILVPAPQVVPPYCTLHWDNITPADFPPDPKSPR